ncbi:MAG: ribbon-helix-helix protein [Steroidobacteraceae bacterium]
MSKPAALTSANVRRKGEAQPAADAVSRGEAIAHLRVPSEALVPLSFKVSPQFKKRYRLAAIEAGLKLNEFLFALLDRHEAEKRKS